MSKLLVEVYVPAISKAYDVLIPCSGKIYDLLPLISSVVTKLSDGHFVSQSPVLCNGDTGNIYNNNMTIEDMRLKNGSRVMLV